jgi:hypothetical protein
MGPKNEKTFLLFYGRRDVIINNMILFIREKIDQDSLAKMIQSVEANN